MSSTPTLSELTGKLFDAKRREDAAKAERIEAEEQIAALVETPENGSKTVDAGNGIKVTVKRAIGYKADVDAIRALGLDDDCMPVKLVPASYAFDEKAYELIRAARPDVAAALADCVVATPRKVSVTMKLG